MKKKKSVKDSKLFWPLCLNLYFEGLHQSHQFLLNNLLWRWSRMPLDVTPASLPCVFLFPGATVFSTGLNLLFTGRDMAVWPELKQAFFGHYPGPTIFCTKFSHLNVKTFLYFFMCRNHDATPTEKGELSLFVT